MRHAYAGPVRLPEVSARANLSPYHFLRVHKEAYGETPHEFLTRLRVERAKGLLARGGHNVTEACFGVGFSSLGSFSALFKERVGLSPSEYRRHARSGILVPREIRPLFVPTCFLPTLRDLPKDGQPQFSRSGPGIAGSTLAVGQPEREGEP
jgi:AraC-like DNA-binding protein